MALLSHGTASTSTIYVPATTITTTITTASTYTYYLANTTGSTTVTLEPAIIYTRAPANCTVIVPVS